MCNDAIAAYLKCMQCSSQFESKTIESGQAVAQDHMVHISQYCTHDVTVLCKVSNNEEINSFTAEVYLGSIRLNYTILQAAGVDANPV